LLVIYAKGSTPGSARQPRISARRTTEAAGCGPVLYAEPLERFDQTRALLDLIGWKDEPDEGPAIVALADHRPALVAALQAQLQTERNMTNEDPALKGAEKQIACARQRFAEIEQFLASAKTGLEGAE
jgi:hypothetical protein